MLASVGGVVGIAVQGRRHLLVAVGKPHTLHNQVLAVLLRQAIGHTQPQGQRTIIGNAGHAQLATARFIPAAQHEELITAGILPVPEPFLMAAITVGFQVVLLPPQPPGPETQPYQPSRDVGFQHHETQFQIGYPALLLMHLSPPATLDSFPNLPLCPSDAPPETVHAQLLLLLDGCHLAFQRHPLRH